MAVEYDIAIIGGSAAGRGAAIAATQLGATVALVEPMLEAGVTSAIAPHALTQIGQIVHQMNYADRFGIHSQVVGITECSELIQWAETTQWALGVSSNLAEQHSPAVLASLGVDVIVGKGQFHRSPHLAFVVNGRSLRARTYLLATSCRPAIPDIEGLQTIGYFTPADIWQQLNSPKLPKKWAILGGDPVGIQMAQTMTRLGFKVTLIVRRSHILPQEDLAAAQLVQATLEAEGVRLLTGMSVTRVLQIQDKKRIQMGDEVIETDEILLATGQISNIESLNLEAVGVKLHQRGLLLNEKLQTTNPHIYACGDPNGSYQFANYEAKIALKNALFFPIFKVDYRSIPWAIFSDPVLARVGLTEAQARRRYPTNQVLVLRQYFKVVAAAQMRTEMTGICQLTVLHNGKILGATLVGPQAGELIQVIALAMSQNLKVSAIAQLAPIYPTMSEILERTSATWNQQRLTNNTRLQDFLENFFNLRRSWS